MSELDNAITSINSSAEKAENTADFLDNWSTYDDVSNVTNPNNGATVPSAQKKIKDLVDENITVITDAADLAEASAASAATSESNAATSASESAASAAEAAANVDTSIAESIEQQSGGMNRYRQDDNGNWNMMVRIPMMTNKVFNDALGTNWLPETDPHPAFIRPDTTTMPWFEVAMYQASNDGSGNPVSAAYKDPYVSVNFDTAKSKCESMGTGWGLMSNAQWAAVALWCLANGYQPLGNTYYGYSHESTYIGGIRVDGGDNGDASGTARIYTGSGGAEFRHNKITQGISDLIGNVWEWVDGLKLVDGQIFVAETERQDEVDWSGEAAYLDTGNELNSSVTGTTSTNVTWGSLGKDASYVENQLLQQHCIEPTTDTDSLNGRLYYNNDGTRLPRRGGFWGSTSDAGFATLNLVSERTGSSANISFRPSYFE